MTVIDEHGTKLTGHAATVYHSDHPELVEINPMKFIHPKQQSVLRTLTAEELGLLEEMFSDDPTDLRSSEAWEAGMTQDEFNSCHKSIPTELYNQLNYLGLIPSDVRGTHVGQSDYSSKLIQPWAIFLDNPDLNYMECDVIKRIIRTNTRDSRKQDLTKCKHIIDELIRQLDTKEQQ